MRSDQDQPSRTPAHTANRSWWTAVAVWVAAMAAFLGWMAWGSATTPWLSIGLFAASVPPFVLTLCARRTWARALVGIGAITMAVVLDYLLVVWSAFPPYEGPAVVGTTVPEFALTDGRGQTRASSELRGHETLLLFFRGKW